MFTDRIARGGLDLPHDTWDVYERWLDRHGYEVTADLHEADTFARRQVCGQLAAQVIAEAAARLHVPFTTEFTTAEGMMEAADVLAATAAGDDPLDGIPLHGARAVIREAVDDDAPDADLAAIAFSGPGIPLHNPAVVTSDGRTFASMAECIAASAEQLPDEQRAALALEGIPLHEASAVSAVPELVRAQDSQPPDPPTHVVAQHLSDVVPPDHERRCLVDEALRRGAAHTADQRHALLGLATEFTGALQRKLDAADRTDFQDLTAPDGSPDLGSSENRGHSRSQPQATVGSSEGRLDAPRQGSDDLYTSSTASGGQGSLEEARDRTDELLARYDEARGQLGEVEVEAPTRGMTPAAIRRAAE
jgi:hypothetical protein